MAWIAYGLARRCKNRPSRRAAFLPHPFPRQHGPVPLPNREEGSSPGCRASSRGIAAKTAADWWRSPRPAALAGRRGPLSFLPERAARPPPIHPIGASIIFATSPSGDWRDSLGQTGGRRRAFGSTRRRAPGNDVPTGSDCRAAAGRGRTGKFRIVRQRRGVRSLPVSHRPSQARREGGIPRGAAETRGRPRSARYPALPARGIPSLDCPFRLFFRRTPFMSRSLFFRLAALVVLVAVALVALQSDASAGRRCRGGGCWGYGGWGGWDCGCVAPCGGGYGGWGGWDSGCNGCYSGCDSSCSDGCWGGWGRRCGRRWGGWGGGCCWRGSGCATSCVSGCATGCAAGCGGTGEAAGPPPAPSGNEPPPAPGTQQPAPPSPPAADQKPPQT